MTLRWQDAYKCICPIGAGGQGDAMVAEPLSGGPPVFLKVLRHQNDMMRRTRMHREVEAYRTLQHSGIPLLVDSNSHEFDKPEYKLFLASALIEGSTLTAYLEANGPLGLNSSKGLVRRLLDTVAYCHANQVVHRDIKPDNIILRHNAADDPVLVDFGLSFEESPGAQGTEHWEELGNRFLRLPELAGGSPNKRDQRSDLTFVAGILLFCLTGEVPSVLVDASNLKPHQRNGILQRFHDQLGKDDSRRLAHFFDQAFQTNLDLRWQNAADMIDYLEALGTTVDDSHEERALRIKKLLAVPHTARAQVVTEKLRRGLDLIQLGMQAAQREFPGLSNSQTGHEIDAGQQIARNSLALVPHSKNVDHYIRFSVSLEGDELVLSASYRDTPYPSFARVPLSEPFNSSKIEAEIRKIFLVQLEDILQ